MTRLARLILFATAIAVGGCNALVDVENPNRVNAEDLENPTAAPSIASGVFIEVAEAWGQSLSVYAMATDELLALGSRDSWEELDQGFLSNRNNEFTDPAFSRVAAARWFADEGIRLLAGFDDDGALVDRTLLARVYLNAAVIYAAIADQWDDFVITSHRTVPGPAVGPENMAGLYDTAIDYLTIGLTVAESEGSTTLVNQTRALRASVAHRRSVWDLLNPAGVPSDPWVTLDAQAIADASAVIGSVGGQDWLYEFAYPPPTPENGPFCWPCQLLFSFLGGQVGDPYLRLLDPIDGTPDPVFNTFWDEFRRDFHSVAPVRLRITHERELYLILAEHAFATGDPQGAQDHIDALRALDGLTLFDRTDPAQPSIAAMIQYHRTSALFLQGRRLADMYRFRDSWELASVDIVDPLWLSTSDAVARPGTFLPITQSECLANPQAGC